MTTTAPLPLTARQREILAWIDAYIREHGYSPTVREVVQAFGFHGPAGAMSHLKPLRKKGWIDWRDGHARTLRVVREVQS